MAGAFVSLTIAARVCFADDSGARLAICVGRFGDVYAAALACESLGDLGVIVTASPAPGGVSEA